MAPLFIRSNGRTVGPRSKAPTLSAPYGLPVPESGLSQLPIGISLCMIVKDEERFLAACLRSVAPFVDEICIVDTGSMDTTLDIAASFGARIEHRAWRNDFAWARNEALAMATKRWIFVLDADEELDAGSAALLRSMRAVPAALTGLWVRCQNLSDDYKGTGVSTHALVRLFPNNPRLRYVSPVHEFISLDGLPTGIEARTGPISITHHGYLSEIVKLRHKSERNLALVKAAVVENPAEPFNWYNLGTTSLLNGDPISAIDALEKMREIAGDSQRGFIPNALAQLADLYTDSGDYDRAVTVANESLRKSPNFANAHFALGRAHAKARRFLEARSAFEAAIADAEYSVRQFIVDDEVSAWKAHSEIGSSFGSEGNDAAALAWFDRALQNRPKVVPVRVNRARALERLGRYDEAEAGFAALADDEPGDAHSIDFINYLLRRNKTVAALAAIEHALCGVTPRVQAALLVTAAKIVGQTGSALPEPLLLRALAAHAGAGDAIAALEALYQARNDQEALARLHADEMTAPMTLAVDYARRATRHLIGGRLAEAEAVTLEGLAVAPDDPALHYNLAAVFVQLGHQQDALAELRLAGSDGDVGLRATFLRAIVLADLGRFDEAICNVDIVIRMAPNEVDARLARFRFADSLGRDADAEATLRAALSLGDGRVAVELATWLMRKGRFSDARSVADAALAPA